MLYIEQVDRSNVIWENTWHVGEPLPHIFSQVVTFQADGDELEVILKALHECSSKLPPTPVVESE